MSVNSLRVRLPQVLEQYQPDVLGLQETKVSINLYIPNGRTVGLGKYAYKLNRLSGVKAFIRDELVRYPRLVFGDLSWPG